MKIMDVLTNFFEMLSGKIWSTQFTVLFLLVGLYFTCLIGFLQVRKLPYVLKETLVRQIRGKTGKGETADKGEGVITAFQAMCTSLAGCVGNGNIMGVTTAILAGGPGAVFWMWVAGFLGMATKYAEIVIGIHYREKQSNGEYVGGPIYYISKGLKMPRLARLFGALLVVQCTGGNLIQSNAAANVVKTMFGIPPAVTAILLSVGIGIIIAGGIRRLGRFSEVVVPLMATLYIFSGLLIILVNFQQVPEILALIVKSAFRVQSGAAGVAGYTVREAMKNGVARGLYSNEAGEGAAPVVHAPAITDHPVRQALFGITEVFIDTIVICSITSLVILITGVTAMGGTPTDMICAAFEQIHPLFKYVLGISMVLFAFSTMPTQWLFADNALIYLQRSTKTGYYKIVFMVFTFIGCIANFKLVWSLMDCILGVLVIPNLAAILYLSPTVRKATREFFARQRNAVPAGGKICCSDHEEIG